MLFRSLLLILPVHTWPVADSGTHSAFLKLWQSTQGTRIIHLQASETMDLHALQVVPLYCFDPRNYIMTPWGNPKTGQFRAQFVLDSVLDLKQSLQNIGSDLIIHLGKPEDAIAGLPASALYVNII